MPGGFVWVSKSNMRAAIGKDTLTVLEPPDQRLLWGLVKEPAQVFPCGSPA